MAISAEPVFDGTLLRRVAALELPHPHHFVLNSSGALAERRVIPMSEVGDIDGSTCETNHSHLREVLGWLTRKQVVGVSDDGEEITVNVTHDPHNQFDIHYWDFSTFDYNRIGQGRITLEEQLLLSDQDPVTGIYVARLEYVERVKRETGREKDARRIAAIQSFQRQHNENE